jgi:hypothetical protein
MNTQEIKEKYPKSYVKLIVFGKELLAQLVTAQLANSSKEEKAVIISTEIPDEHIQPFLDGLLFGNSRTLFDLFDSSSIYISIVKRASSNIFYFTINGEDLGSVYTNRVECEHDAFDNAFIKLEETI